MLSHVQKPILDYASPQTRRWEGWDVGILAVYLVTTMALAVLFIATLLS